MGTTKVIVGLGSCGIAAGANKTYEKILSLQKVDQLDFELKRTSCVGMCFREPLVEIIDETGSYIYGNIDADRAVELIEKHIKLNEPVKEYVVKSDMFETPDQNFLKDQVKIALRNRGLIYAESIE